MRAILKQTSWLFVAQSLTRVVSFFYTIFLAKTLGVSDFGLYTVALAYLSIISSIADFGFNRFLIREVAKNKSKVSELLGNIVILRLTLTAILFAAFSIILYVLDQDKMRVSLILLSTLAVLPQVIALTFDAIFIAIQKLQFSAAGLFISSLFTALTGLYLVRHGFGPLGAVSALIIGQVIYATILIIFMYKHEKLVLPAIKLTEVKEIVIGSLPYGLLGILSLLYFRIDAILLSYLRGSFETGIYGVAYKFLEGVIFIPSAFSVALFPVLVKVHDYSLKDVRRLYFKSFKIMLGLGLTVFLGYVLILPTIIAIVLPKYLSSIMAIKILSLSIPFMFIHIPAVSVLLSTDRFLKPIILLSFVTLGFNIITNLIFIPQFGFMAAAWVTTLSEILSFVVFYLLVKIKVLDAKG